MSKLIADVKAGDSMYFIHRNSKGKLEIVRLRIKTIGPERNRWGDVGYSNDTYRYATFEFNAYLMGATLATHSGGESGLFTTRDAAKRYGRHMSMYMPQREQDNKDIDAMD